MSVQLKAGYAKVDITPAYPVPLGGFGNTHTRIHERVLDPIYAVCVAVSDGEGTLLLYHLDLVYMTEENVAVCKRGIEERFGIPQKNILLNVTHTHSAPDLRSELDSMKRYTAEFCEKVVALAGPAIADLDETEITIGSGVVEGWNFVRRYLLSDGSYGGANFGDFQNNTILAHESEADHVMQAVRLVRKHKKDILLVNWQTHPQRTHGDTAQKRKDLSSDTIGRFRADVEREHDVLFSYCHGCGGNIDCISRIPGETRSRDYTVIAQGLADGLTPILGKMRPVKSGKIVSSITTFVGKVNHEWDGRVDDAHRILSYWEQHGRDEATVYARSLGFNSVYHALAVIDRATMPPTRSYEIGAVAFGDVCIAWTPNELYDTTGIYLKATSPFEMTFICGYTNGAQFYMPTLRAFAHGGYGPDKCHFPAGTTEKLTQEILEQILKVRTGG